MWENWWVVLLVPLVPASVVFSTKLPELVTLLEPDAMLTDVKFVSHKIHSTAGEKCMIKHSLFYCYYVGCY